MATTMLGDRQQRPGRNLRGNIQVAQSEKAMAKVQCHSLMSSQAYFHSPQLFASYFRQNRITRVPETISSLVQLETLSLSSNHLIDLPESLSRMPAIRNIYVNGNALTEIPEELVRSATLQVPFQHHIKSSHLLTKFL